jgi:hypothetical protein
MTSEWSRLETNRHQDHVIAHVIGTKVLGYFVAENAARLLLDIGFIWTIFIDGEMGLLTQTLAINELELDAATKAQLHADVQVLHSGDDFERLVQIIAAPVECVIEEVNIYAQADKRRVVIAGEEASLILGMSLSGDEVHIAPLLT